MAYVNLFNQQLNGYGASMPQDFQLATSSPDYQLPAYQAPAPSLGNYGQQLSMSSGGGAAAPDMTGSYVSAAGQAAATTAKIISDAVAADATRAANAREGKLNREFRQNMANQQVSNVEEASSKNRESNAYKMLMAALSAGYMNQDASFRNNRNANSSVDEILASAMLRRR